MSSSARIRKPVLYTVAFLIFVTTMKFAEKSTVILEVKKNFLQTYIWNTITSIFVSAGAVSLIQP